MDAACSNCNDPGSDDLIPGPLGVKIDDHNERIDIVLAIPGIKKPGPFTSSKNTFVDAKFESESLRILVHLNPNKVVTRSSSHTAGKYLYKIKRLPDKITPEASSFRLGKNKLVVTLRKLKHGSWQHILDTRGLEQDDDY